jgi:hypothetical protein
MLNPQLLKWGVQEVSHARPEQAGGDGYENNDHPGKYRNEERFTSTSWPSTLMRPQSDVGGCTPSPRELIPSPTTMAMPIRAVENANTGGRTFGRSSPARMDLSRALEARAAMALRTHGFILEVVWVGGRGHCACFFILEEVSILQRLLLCAGPEPTQRDLPKAERQAAHR